MAVRSRLPRRDVDIVEGAAGAVVHPAHRLPHGLELVPHPVDVVSQQTLQLEEAERLEEALLLR